MAPSRRTADADQPLLQTLGTDMGRVYTDVMKRGVRRQIRGTLSDLESFYLSEENRRELAGMGAVGRTLHRLLWLGKSLLLRLTPARRVLLASGLLFIFWNINRVMVGSVRVPFPTRVIGDVLILVVLMLELKDKLIARDELEAGRKVQLALMPERNPSIPGWESWLYTEPANDVGGDLVDHVPIDDQHHGVALADVAGKALPAALLMVKLQATLRALVPQFATLAELGSAINRILVRDGLPNRFATLVYLILPTGSGPVRVLNAGHMAPLVVRGGRPGEPGAPGEPVDIEEMPNGSMALGFISEATYAEQQIELSTGDVLIVYSDGVTEAMNTAGEFFGDARLRAAIHDTAGQPVKDIATRILGALQAFVGEAPPHDDVSLIVLRKQ